MNDQPNTDKNIFDTHKFDELLTSLEQLAEILSKYHTSLLENGIPENLANDLVVEMQTKFLYNRSDE